MALVMGSTSPLELDTALQKAGVPVSSVHLLNMSPPSMRAAWQSGTISAAYVWDPVFSALVSDHGKALMWDQNVESTAPIFNLSVVNSQWAKAHPALVEGFIKAQASGVAFYHAHPAAAMSDMAKEAGISVPLAKVELAGYFLETLASQLGHAGMGTGRTIPDSLVAKSLVAAGRYLLASNTISQLPPSLASFVNPTYVEKLVGQKSK